VNEPARRQISESEMRRTGPEAAGGRAGRESFWDMVPSEAEPAEAGRSAAGGG
jgi:hypothetical protein